MAGTVSNAAASRFVREAEIAATVDHANLLPVLDVGLAGGTPFLVMELADGGSLDDMRDRFGDRAWALPLLAQVAAGLAALHERGIAHRDLKPANVLVTRGEGDEQRARISDFGISRIEDTGEVAVLDATARPALTATGAAVGTPLYMAPEAARGAAGLPADVFGFGAMAYEMLAGMLPYSIPPAFEVLSGRAPSPPTTLAAAGVELPVAIERVLGACLSLDPAERPTAKQLSAAFAQVRTTAS
jgi:serine/threonine-protein kinase